MNRIIINNKTDLTDWSALHMINLVIESGRISNNNTQYCHMTVFKREDKKYQVITDLTDKSDVFTIIETKYI